VSVRTDSGWARSAQHPISFERDHPTYRRRTEILTATPPRHASRTRPAAGGDCVCLSRLLQADVLDEHGLTFEMTPDHEGQASSLNGRPSTPSQLDDVDQVSVRARRCRQPRRCHGPCPGFGHDRSLSGIVSEYEPQGRPQSFALELLQGGRQALAASDWEALRSLCHEDVVWRVPGRSPRLGTPSRWM
jgi:hypothetical protein